MIIDNKMSNAIASMAAALNTQLMEETAQKSEKVAETQNADTGQNMQLTPQKQQSWNPYAQLGDVFIDQEETQKSTKIKPMKAREIDLGVDPFHKAGAYWRRNIKRIEEEQAKRAQKQDCIAKEKARKEWYV